MYNLPKELEELKTLKQWVCYRLEPRPTKADPNHLGKVPYNPVTGYGAKANDPGTWVDYETARRAAESGQYAGIGFELGNSGYCGIDIDHCVTDGQANEAAAKIARHIGSYTEYSVSGTGLHIITKAAPLERTGYNDPKNGSGIDLEVYRPVEKKGGTFVGEVEGGRFLTISGNIYGDALPIADRTAKVSSLVKHYWPPKEAPTTVGSLSPAPDGDTDRKILLSALDAIDPAGLDFNEWAAVVSAMKACGFSAQDAEAWSSAGGNPKNVAGYIYKRWNKFHLPNRDDSRAGGVIVSMAKRNGWAAADAFTDEERRQYGIEQHRTSAADDFRIDEGWAEHTALEVPQEAAETPQEAPKDTRPGNVLAYIESGAFTADIDRYNKFKDRKTGYSNMDEVQPLYPGLYVLGSISSLGKTTFAHQMADHLASAGDEVLYFSLEQNRLELVSKSLSRRMFAEDMNLDNKHYSAIDIRRGLAADVIEEYVDSYALEVGNRLSIVDANFNCNIEQITGHIKAYMDANQVRPVVFIDYLQIITPSTVNGRPMDTKTSIDHIVHELKAFQSRYNLVVIAICSLNRQNYLTQIDFESFKESGGIEYTADVVWGLQLQVMHDEIFTKDTKINEKRQKVKEAKAAMPREIELCCLKNRYGRANYTCGFNYYPAFDYFVPQSEFDDTDRSYSTWNYSTPEPAIVKPGKREAQRRRLEEAFAAVDAINPGTVTLYDLAEVLDVTQATVKRMIKEYGGYSISKDGQIVFDGDIHSEDVERKEFVGFPGASPFDKKE